MILRLVNRNDIPETINAAHVDTAWIEERNHPSWDLKYVVNGSTFNVPYASRVDAEAALNQLHSAMKGQNMLKNILNDVREFISLHRNVIYWLALAFLVDHFFLNGKFREKLNTLVEKLLKKIEKQVDATKIA